MATRKKKINIGAFGHPIYGKGFAKYGEMRPNGSSETPNDLEEAAGEYEKKHTYQRYDGGGLTPEYDATLAEAFIAGAKWQKEQMMKEAIEAVARPLDKEIWCDLDKFPELEDGDDIQIIIIKKED